MPAATAQRPTTNRPEQAAKRLFDFSRSADAAAFRSVDDRVMGGVSRSSLQPTGAATAVFAGDLSLKQNGGFASVRASDLKLDVSAAEGIVVRVRGDGNIYKLRVADKPGFNAIAYQSAFVAPAGQWREIRLPFADFIPVWRGRRVRDASPLDRSSIRRMGVMISDKQEGRFRLELAWVGVY